MSSEYYDTHGNRYYLDLLLIFALMSLIARFMSYEKWVPGEKVSI